MRHTTAVLVCRPTVHNFLDHQVSSWVRRQVCNAADEIEVLALSMKIAGDHHFIGLLGGDADNSTLSAGSGKVRGRGFAHPINHLLDIFDLGNHGPRNYQTRQRAATAVNKLR